MINKPTDFDNHVNTHFNQAYLPPNSNTAMRYQADNVSNHLVNYNHVTYALAMFSYFTAGLTWIIPIVMNYLKRDEARGTWLYSHFDWQIKTFWYTIFFGGIAIVMMTIGFGGSILGVLFGSTTVAGSTGILGILGAILLGFVVIWHLYRMVRGWIALANRRAVP